MAAVCPATSLRAEPRWIPRSRLRRSDLPAAHAAWLLDRASLTRRLAAACPGGFRVRVLRQTRARPLPSESALLRMRPPAHALVREVQLLCHDTPWVYARTVIPPQSLRGALRRLSRLGARSLGAVLFAHRSLERGPMEVARLTPQDALYRAALSGRAGPPEIWARRSVFRVGEGSLLVCEFFLAALGGFPR